MATVSDLITPKSRDVLFEEGLGVARDEGLPTTSWQAGSVPRTLLKADATALADLHSTQASIAKGAFLDDAEGPWLTLHAASRFQVTRTPAVFCRGYVRVTVASGAGPYTISAAGLLVSDGARRWRSVNATAITITSAAPVDVLVEAEASGADYNVATGTVITVLVSPALAGVSVSNPAYASGTWITRSGAAEESDASVRARCRAKWGTLGRGANDSAYEYWARTGHGVEAQVTRAQVVWGAGDGKVTVWLAGPSGAVGSSDVATVKAWVEANKPGTDNTTTAADSGIKSASAVTVSLIATITVAAASDSTANRARATAALSTYFAALDIAEDVDLGRLYQCLYAAAGVLDADITQPSADVSINNGEIATLTVALTWNVV
jgi:uncharacterized phage protein gp47/JayE